MRFYLVFFLLFFCFEMHAQYLMSNQTVNDCEGTLSDSEANSQQAGWYDHNENFVFTICPNGAAAIIIDFSFFNTEPTNDYVLIYDGPNISSPVLAGPFSGINTPPQIISNGCVTIVFVSDLNVAADGFNLSWETIIDVPDPPQLSLVTSPSCSTSVLEVLLDQKIHCDSVYTANISVGGQINQTVNAVPLSCLNDSTNLIQLNLFPGLNQSGSYNIFFQSYFEDVCDSVWSLSSSLVFDILDCPLIVDLVTDNDTICLGDCTDLNVYVSGGDASTYFYNWTPILPNNSGPHQVCPITTS
ncbi:MAG: CUB domain-containing protein, partial [Flavobacteriales bacterium]|nr:CUB domain-containing protein [Flavobacteriales bacterium]